jgi:pectate lyase
MMRPLLYTSVLPALLLLINCSSSPEGEEGDGSAGSPGVAGSSSSSAGSGPSGSSGSGTGVAGSSNTGTAGAGNTGGSPNGSGGTGSGGTSPTDGGATGEGGMASGGTPNGGGGGSAQGGMSTGGTGGMGTSGSSTGGMASGGMASGGAGSGGMSNPNDKTIPMTIPTPTNGSGEIRTSTTVLKNAAQGGKDVWDFNNAKIGVNNTEDCEGGEGQKTVFEVEDGVTVRNLIIAGGIAGGNGIVCKGNCTLEYVYWEDICEDAATNSKDGATMRLNHVIALKATDKVFQHNAKGGSKTVITNSYISTFGKLWRSCGDCTSNGGPRHLEIDNVRVDGISTAVAGANQNYGDTVTIRNLFVKGGYDSSKDKPKICTEYIGVTDHNGESTKVNDGKSQWNTTTCKVSQSDVKSY